VVGGAAAEASGEEAEAAAFIVDVEEVAAMSPLGCLRSSSLGCCSSLGRLVVGAARDQGPVLVLLSRDEV